MPWLPRRTRSRLFPPEHADLAFATFLLKILAPGTFTRDRPDRASPAARLAASWAALSPVACQYSCSPQAGASDSWKEERRPVAAGSQFRPPSGHCQAIRDPARDRTRGSAARPSRQQAARAFPSIEAWGRASPPITWTRRAGLASQART